MAEPVPVLIASCHDLLLFRTPPRGRSRRQRPHGPHAHRGDPGKRRLRAGRRAGPAHQPRRGPGRHRLPGPRERRGHHRRPARGAEECRCADRLLAPRGHAGPCGRVGRAGRADGHRHHGLLRRAEGRHGGRRAQGGHRARAQHERGRERHAQAAADGRAGARHGLRHRDHRGAPQAQGGRALGHGPEDGRGDRRGAGHAPCRPCRVRALRPHGRAQGGQHRLCHRARRRHRGSPCRWPAGS